jgi:hypothetical protein
MRINLNGFSDGGATQCLRAVDRIGLSPAALSAESISALRYCDEPVVSIDGLGRLNDTQAHSRLAHRFAHSKHGNLKQTEKHHDVRLQMVWDNLNCLGTEALARLGLSLGGFQLVLLVSTNLMASSSPCAT